MIDRDREDELQRLRKDLASRRADWVPRVATNAHACKEGWRIADISGAEGESLTIYRNPQHRAHVDYNGKQWRGDDLELIRELCRLPDFPSTIEHAAGLIGFPLKFWRRRKKSRASGKGRGAYSVFDYCDEDGRVVFQVCRDERKQIWQRRPDPEHAGAFIENLKGVELVLYRLPELIQGQRHGKIIFIVEGEKKADLLAKWGEVATCNAGGAGKWREQYNSSFVVGAKVVILPDHDAPGFKHAWDVARNLHPIVGELSVVDLPNLGLKDDVVDWAERGGTREQLLELAEAAPEWTPETEMPALEQADAGSVDDANLADPNSSIELLDETLPPDFTEDAIALNFAEKHERELRFVAMWNKWLSWDGARWRFDETLRVYDLARVVCRQAASECKKRPKVASILASARTVAAAERLAKADRRLAATVDQWDADIWLLNTPAGTVDLHSGELRPHRREDFCTKMTAVAPGGECPIWLAFLKRVTGDNAELEAFLQRFIGYSLTGATHEHQLVFAHGVGGNGKGTFLNTVTGIMCDYAATAPMETFTATGTERHPADLAMLRAARLVAAQETEEGRRWAESRVKAVTGGDPITARFMRQDFFTFVPQFKLFVAGNHKPGLRGVDEAMRRRMNLVPFGVVISANERDPQLADKLKTEWRGILQWMIAGCLEWQRLGLQSPAIVRVATDEYLAGEDAIGTWLEECCKTGSGYYTTTGELFKSWTAWAATAGEFVGSQKRFAQALLDRGFAPRRHGPKGVYDITVLRNEQESPDMWEH